MSDETVPWPYELASATALLLREGIGATLVDSIATRESVDGWLDRIEELAVDAVAIATSAPSLSADLALVASVADARPTILLWPGDPDGAEAVLSAYDLRAVVCGEPELGLLAAVQIDSAAVYPPDPVRDLDELPHPYRDYTVHRYRLPLRGAPDGPGLPLRVSRGPQRWRGLEAVADEMASCRRNYPRLTHLVITDPEVNANAAAFAALADRLNADGWPWCARIRLGAGWELPVEARGARALEVRLYDEPDADVLAQLRWLAAAGVGLTLAPTVSSDRVAVVAEDLGAAVQVRPTARPTSLREAVIAAAAAPAEPLPTRRRLFVVGMHRPEYMPPGLVRAATELGWRGVAIDPYAQPNSLRRLLDSRPEEVVIVDRGAGLPPELIPRIPARTVLYSPEILPTLEATHPHAEQRYAEFAPLAPAFDHVVLHDGHPLEFLRARGHDNIRGVVPLPYDPVRVADRGLDRDLDVLFVGSPSDHRREWIDRLAEEGVTVTWPEVWGADFVATLNRAKIALNLHFTPLANTELRVVEAMACGALVVSEALTPGAPFIHGEHLVIVTRETAAESIRYYLAHPEERERIARAGQEYVAAHHTARHCLERILALTDDRS